MPSSTASASATRAPGKAGLIGASPPRREDDRLLTGEARFVGDLALEGMLHARLVRSPLAHARIRSIEAAEAMRVDGVMAVLSAADLPEGTPPIPIRLHARPGMERFLQPPLAAEVVRYGGEPVALVVAESPYAAEDAAELVAVDYDPLDPVAELASAAEGPVIHEDAGTNVADTLVIEWGDAERAFSTAPVVVEQRLVCNRHASVPLETRGLAAELDAGTGLLTVYGAAKVPHANRDILARMLGWPEERIRLVELDVGGAFGARGEFYPEDFLVPFAAQRLGRPVAWVEDRAEHLRACNHSRGQIHEIALALDRDGSFLALRDDVVSDAGAYVRTQGFLLPGMTGSLLPGPYRWPAYRFEATHVLTTTTPTGACRAPGRYEANFARERIIDIAAHRLGLDPIEIRRRNLIEPGAMPYATGTHTHGHPVVYDTGDYPLLLRRGLEELAWDGILRWRDEPLLSSSLRRGVGIAFVVEKSGVAHWEAARVEITGAGTTRVHTGASSVGQGLETALAQICADALGVRYEDIDVLHGDTAALPDGVGTYGSRATSIAGSAVHRAAQGLRARLLALAAQALALAPEDLDLAGDRVVASGDPSRAISLAELAALAPTDGADRGSGEAGLSESHVFRADEPSYPYGLHLAAVEVDTRTGAARICRYAVAYDVGRAINPDLARAQIVGGAAQGIGGALLEELAYDEDGQLVSGSFVDYLLPTAAETPPIDVLITEDAPTSHNPLGVKGAGEGGAAGAGAAIANAASDALGTEVGALPLSPGRVLELAREAAR